MILDYLWRYPPYIILLIMVDSVCLLSPSVSYPPVYGSEVEGNVRQQIIANDKKVLFDMTYVSQSWEMRKKNSFSLEYRIE